MQYVKKVIVLKSTQNSLEANKRVNGILRVEIENGVAELHLSLVNLPKSVVKNYFALFIDSEKREFEFDLGCRPTSSALLFPTQPKLNKGFCVGIYAIKNSLPMVFAFANDCNFSSLEAFKKIVADKCLTIYKKQVKETEKIDENLSLKEPDFYNDEAVATENYFEIDDKIKQKLLSLKERKNEDVQLENELFDCNRQEETQKNCSKSFCVENEKDFAECQNACNTRHFDMVKTELDEIFFKFPEEECLKKHFKDSRWAKIYYSDNKYYVVGVIFEEKQEKYICYGVPAKYSKTPPKELAGFCSFVPISIFDMLGDGYWIMFQDAESGNCVHFN